jgi:hypothetical protein
MSSRSLENPELVENPKLQPRYDDRRDEFISRCMETREVCDAFADKERRLTFCENQWKRYVERVGIPSEIDGELLTYDGGKIIPAEWADGDPTQEAIDNENKKTPEERYIDRLQLGMGRLEAIEARIDMTKIDLEDS